MKSLLRAVAWVAGLAAGAAYAGGPLQVCSSGLPMKYPGSGLVTLNYDGGGATLGTRTKAQADAIVTNAVSLWTNVNTSTVTLARGADLPVDVIGHFPGSLGPPANFSAYLDNFTDGLNPVIYDTDGSIVDELFGINAKSSVLGFAGSAYSTSPCQYVEGRAVINGYIVVSDATMTIVMAHEVGHLIGLDHTQLDSTQGLTTSNYPLMYPIAYRNLISLHDDDAAAVSTLYPDATFNSVYGQVSGNLRASGGVTPVLGANVWAEEVTTHKVYSVVSDYLVQGNGYFKLSLPAGTYTLHAEAIDSQFTGGSGVGPYSDTYPTSPSFQPPLYSGSTPMAPVTLGGGAPIQFSIVPGCAATATFALSGVGSIGGNCVTKANPTLGLSSSLNPSTAGQNVSFTASLSGSAGTPTGTVNFRDGASSISGCSAVGVTAGTAVCTTAALIAGSHSITAVYSGDGAYNTATSAAVSQSVVAKPSRAITLTSSANPSTTPQAVTFAAALGGAVVAPMGSVDFFDGGSPISGCAGTVVNSSVAQCTTATLTAGPHSITATYSGDATYGASTSSALSQNVQAGPTNVALASAGAVATASSAYSSAYAATMVNDNERTGRSGGVYRIWTDATPAAFPDWVQIDFGGWKSIDRVVVYSMQDAYWSPVEPNDTQTFATYGASSFTVQGWDGTSWVTLGTVTGNNLVKRTVTFSAFTTNRIRVNVTGSASGNSNITEVEAWGVAASAPAIATNVALASTGAVATASSAYSSAYAATMVNDNERTGLSGGAYRIWTDATPGAFPDWVQIDFNGPKTIDRVVVYSQQDAYWSPVEPNDTQTFVTYGASSFTVQGWDGTNWVTLGTVTGNNLVKRTVSFAAYTTNRIRVNVTGSASGNSNITEVEAWGVAAAALPNATNVALASAGGVATASSAYSSAYAATMVNDNERTGLSGGAYRIWTDATPGAFPDWVQIDFNGSKTIDRVVVYSQQDAYWSPVEPNDTQTFATYGASSFTVQGWDGANWVTLGTVTGNNLVKRTVTFAPYATSRIRVNVTASPSGNSNITEIEAWGN